MAKLLPASDSDDDDDQGTEPVILIDCSWTPQDEEDLQEIFGVTPSDIQDGFISVVRSDNGAVMTGTSKYLESVNTFDMELGHHFVLLRVYTSEWGPSADSIKVSMDPTQGNVATLDESGVVLLQMKDDHSQNIKIVAEVDGTEYTTIVTNNLTFAEEVQENEPGQ